MSKLYNEVPEKLCLVYGGKIMKDEESVRSYGVKNEHSVHLVVRAPAQRAATATLPNAPSSTSPAAGQTAAGKPSSVEPGRKAIASLTSGSWRDRSSAGPRDDTIRHQRYSRHAQPASQL